MGTAQRSGAGLVAVAAAPAGAGLRRPLPPRALTRETPPGIVRLVAFAALCAFCSLGWARQVAPAADAAAWGWTLVAVALGAVVLVTRDRPARVRAVILAGAVLVALAAALLLCGVPSALLAPREWGALASGIGQGLQALPDVRVPYRGADEWVRTVVLAGGALLAAAAAVLACHPGRSGRGRPIAAAVLLGTMYAVPVVVRGPDHPFAGGALLAVLVAAMLWADRLGPAQVPAGVGLVAAAVVAGLLAAPRVDGQRPWIDPQHLADGLSATSSVRFDWSHRYTPLDWPRDGREALRVASRTGAYWKGVTLDRFDGVRWRRGTTAQPVEVDTEMTPNHPEWRQTVRVVVRDMRSRELYAPGDVLSISGLGRGTLPASGGTRVLAPGRRALKPGDSYRAEAYVPTPSVRELRAAGTDYPPGLDYATHLELPRSVGGPSLTALGQPTGSSDIATLVVPFFGTDGPIMMAPPGAPYSYAAGRQALLRSDLAPVYRLSRRLAAGAQSPYEVVRRVLRRVRTGSRYTETPPRRRLPLVDFLFGSRLGYCQQFSGAMTLLLRMAGIPARVAEGFAPGTFDRGRGEYVVRDLDAHSWVEVYFPQLGWVTFDPTPSSAPPASQASDGQSAAGGGVSGDRGGDRPAERSRAVGGGAQDGGGRTLLAALVVGGLLLVLTAGLVLGGRARRTDDGPPELAELRRVLARTGRAPAPGTTLHAIEATLAGDAAAQGYVRALRLRRYGAAAPAVTPAGRAALRRALAAGLGPLGRLRAWSAMPPTAAELGGTLVERLRRRPYTG